MKIYPHYSHEGFVNSYLVGNTEINFCVKVLKKKKKSLTIAIDGKEIRSTGKMKRYDSPLHIVSAQIGELGLTLAQATVQSKSNEIPAVQELIKTLEIEGCMVVADALNCQI